MPEKETLERAEEDKREGKHQAHYLENLSAKEIEHVREGKHRVRSNKQAIRLADREAESMNAGTKAG
jgi:hypothetical protein